MGTDLAAASSARVDNKSIIRGSDVLSRLPAYAMLHFIACSGPPKKVQHSVIDGLPGEGFELTKPSAT